MFFSSITADYTKMGYPKAIVRALDFLKNTDLKHCQAVVMKLKVT